MASAAVQNEAQGGACTCAVHGGARIIKRRREKGGQGRHARAAKPPPLVATAMCACVCVCVRRGRRFEMRGDIFTAPAKTASASSVVVVVVVVCARKSTRACACARQVLRWGDDWTVWLVCLMLERGQVRVGGGGAKDRYCGDLPVSLRVLKSRCRSRKRWNRHPPSQRERGCGAGGIKTDETTGAPHCHTQNK